MNLDPNSPAERRRTAARELLRRKRAQDSLHSFALSIDVPMSPVAAFEDLDEDLMGTAHLFMALHHALILGVLERTLTRPFGRCIIMSPPGTAKSSYCNVGAAWKAGRTPKSRGIFTSYNSTLAEKQSRRVQQIVKQQLYRDIWDEPLEITREAVSDWALSNESELMAAGITAGITGNRADYIFIDDPVAGREEADSELMRKKVLDAYQDDLLTRLLPGGSVCLVLTRWHEQDLAGSILPDNYAGESGMILCKDNMVWEVLNLQAKCERADDPLGRAIGEYMWPEWFPDQHWQMFERAAGKAAQRTWSSLYQGRPTPVGNEAWDRNWFKWQDPQTFPHPRLLRRAITSDWAVTDSQQADFSVFLCWGIDDAGEIYLLDGWEGQVNTDVGIDKILDMGEKNQVRLAFDEKGVIHNSIAPAYNKRQKARRVWLRMMPIGSTTDKVARVQSFQAIAATGIVHLPSRGPVAVIAEKMFSQLEALPAGRWNDHADAAGLFGRVIDQIMNAPKPPPGREPGIRPFTQEWLEYQDKVVKAVRFV